MRLAGIQCARRLGALLAVLACCAAGACGGSSPTDIFKQTQPDPFLLAITPVSLEGTDPPSPANENYPRVLGTALPNAQVGLFLDEECILKVATGNASLLGKFEIPLEVPENAYLTIFAAMIDRTTGAKSPCSPDPVDYIEDSIPPELGSAHVWPYSPSNNNTPEVSVSFWDYDYSDTFVSIYTNPTCSEPAAGTGNGYGWWIDIPVNVPDDSTTNFYLTATDYAGNSIGCTDLSLTYVEDSTPPSVPVLTGTTPTSPANDSTISVLGTAEASAIVLVYPSADCSGTGLSYVYANISGNFTRSYTVPTPGATVTFSATAADKAGNESACSPATISYTDLIGIVYVDASQAGAADGTSWATAFPTVQEAVASLVDAGDQIWIAQGTYRPSAVNQSVLYANNVEVYGGFLGTESSPADRPSPLPRTVLSGDYADDDPVTTDNSNHVVYVTGTSRLDGLTITGGAATGYNATGGGIYFYDYSGMLTMTHTVIAGNKATATSGTSGVGGGAYIYARALLLTDVTFVENTVSNSTVARGGGLYLSISYYYGAPASQFANAIFNENQATGSTSAAGGGFYCYNCPASIVNVSFVGNHADGSGGGMAFSDNPTITNATFYNNSAAVGGAGLYFTSSVPYLYNVALYGNTGGSGPKDMLSYYGFTPTVANTCSEEAHTGTGNITLGADPFVQMASGEVFLSQASACVDVGNNGLADSAIFGYPTYSEDWRNLTTDLDGAVIDGASADAVDAGFHHDPANAWIKTFDAPDGTTLTWTTNGAAACEITNDQDASVIAVAAMDLDSGMTAHALPSGTVFTMSCEGAPFGAEAAITVP